MKRIILAVLVGMLVSGPVWAEESDYDNRFFFCLELRQSIKKSIELAKSLNEIQIEKMIKKDKKDTIKLIKQWGDITKNIEPLITVYNDSKCAEFSGTQW